MSVVWPGRASPYLTKHFSELNDVLFAFQRALPEGGAEERFKHATGSVIGLSMRDYTAFLSRLYIILFNEYRYGRLFVPTLGMSRLLAVPLMAYHELRLKNPELPVEPTWLQDYDPNEKMLVAPLQSDFSITQVDLFRLANNILRFYQNHLGHRGEHAERRLTELVVWAMESCPMRTENVPV